MPKTFNPDTELPDLSGKVIVVTGGMDSPKYGHSCVTVYFVTASRADYRTQGESLRWHPTKILQA